MLHALQAFADFPLGPKEGRVELIEIALISPLQRVAELRVVEPSPSRLTIDFETPTWIETTALEGRLPTSLPLRLLLRSIHNRLSVLCHLYGEFEPEDVGLKERLARLREVAAKAKVIRESLRPFDWSRRPQARGREPLKGLVGSMELRGNLGEIAGLLRMAEITHVGSWTSQGLGRITVTVIE